MPVPRGRVAWHGDRALHVLLALAAALAVAAVALLAATDDVRLLRLSVVLTLWAILLGAAGAARHLRHAGGGWGGQVRQVGEVRSRREADAALRRDVGELRHDLAALHRHVLDALGPGGLTGPRLPGAPGAAPRLHAESERLRGPVPVLEGTGDTAARGDSGGGTAAPPRVRVLPAGAGSGPAGASRRFTEDVLLGWPGVSGVSGRPGGRTDFISGISDTAISASYGREDGISDAAARAMTPQEACTPDSAGSRLDEQGQLLHQIRHETVRSGITGVEAMERYFPEGGALQGDTMEGDRPMAEGLRGDPGSVGGRSSAAVSAGMAAGPGGEPATEASAVAETAAGATDIGTEGTGAMDDDERGGDMEGQDTAAAHGRHYRNDGDTGVFTRMLGEAQAQEERPRHRRSREDGEENEVLARILGR